jgi:hypothetical protein
MGVARARVAGPVLVNRLGLAQGPYLDAEAVEADTPSDQAERLHMN